MFCILVSPIVKFIRGTLVQGGGGKINSVVARAYFLDAPTEHQALINQKINLRIYYIFKKLLISDARLLMLQQTETIPTCVLSLIDSIQFTLVG